MRRGLIIILAATVLVACSSSKKKDEKKEAVPANPPLEQFNREKDCADPKWKETHLGLWYNVCRDNRSL
jgi:hypothetical protein